MYNGSLEPVLPIWNGNLIREDIFHERKGGCNIRIVKEDWRHEERYVVRDRGACRTFPVYVHSDASRRGRAIKGFSLRYCVNDSGCIKKDIKTHHIFDDGKTL